MDTDRMQWKKTLANPMGLEIKDTKVEPIVGDAITITDWELFSKKEIVELSKLPYLTVSEVYPVCIGEDGDYHWEYEVYTEEAPETNILGWHYKLKK